MKAFDVEAVLTSLSLEEKCRLVRGKGFWHLQDIPQWEVEGPMVTDGPHGLRIQRGEGDHVGIGRSEQSTCFPTAVTLASSWDRELIEELGRAIGEEAQAEGVSVVLGPGINIKRSPLCGRNFEYYSEDPLLSGKLAASFIKGVQSQGVGTSLKHFAANNQESQRMVVDAIVDERTLREIYLRGFEIAVKESQPWTLMGAYNRINGTYACENPWLLTKVLKEEWGHEGLVVTDWGASNDRVAGLQSGNEIEMPSSGTANDERLLAAIQSGELKVEELDRAVRRILQLYGKILQGRKTNWTYDKAAHHQLAVRAAEESMVLLKNQNNALPLGATESIAVIGQLASTPRFQGAGSSQVNPTQVVSALDGITALLANTPSYAPGYSTETDRENPALVQEALRCASEAETIVFFGGLPDLFESEGFDREHLEIPENQRLLLDQLAQLGKKLIVVLSNGSPVLIHWEDRVHAIIEAYLGGQGSGTAIARVLFGEANPSGKLAETFPQRLEDTPSYGNFPGSGRQVVYREGLNIGYRYYETAQVPVAFPFGHGLSYTTFSYSGGQLSSPSVELDQVLSVTCTLTNTGKVSGSEVVQVYVHKGDQALWGPKMQLAGFAKVSLQPGESKQVTISLDPCAYSFYDVGAQTWVSPAGMYQAQIGSSIGDIRLSLDFSVSGTEVAPTSYPGREPSRFEEFVGGSIPVPEASTPFHRNSAMGDLKDHKRGRRIYNIFTKAVAKQFSSEDADPGLANMVEKMMDGNPLRSMVLMGGGRFSFKRLDALIAYLNRGGIVRLLRVLFTK